jgi:tetratricopeptide (TPR) repeat protein
MGAVGQDVHLIATHYNAHKFRAIAPSVFALWSAIGAQEAIIMKRAHLLGFQPLLIAGTFIALQTLASQSPGQEQRRAPILIPGIQEPEEMRVEPVPTKKIDLTVPERLMAEALQNSDKSKPTSLLPALNLILATYTNFSDGYIMRAFALCDAGADPAAIAADLDRALQHSSAPRTGKESSLSLLSTRAKMQLARGDYVAALDGLEKAILADLASATQFTNSSAAQPEKTASACVWTEPDMDALVQRFPADYRSHMFRGLYFSFFVNFSPEDWIIARATENFDRATRLNPRSALPQLFKARLLGHFFVFNTRLNQLGWGDAAREKLNTELAGEYTKALAVDPNLVLALKGRATALFNLKQFQKAIADYNRILELAPQDKSSYHDRGLAKMFLGRDYDAVSDFSAAIKIQPRELMQHYSYESRGDAHVKMGEWELAVRDFTAAISLQVGGSVLLMNVGQFRAIYPEYSAASNEAIARKI